MNPADIRVGKTYRSKSGSKDYEVIAIEDGTVTYKIIRLGTIHFAAPVRYLGSLATFARWADHEVVELP